MTNKSDLLRWFKRPTPQYIDITAPPAEKSDRIPKDLWHRCRGCGTITLRKDFVEQLSVCPSCDRHERMRASDRIRSLLDEGSFQELHGNLVSDDPLEFEDKRKYKEYIEISRKKTGANDSLIMGRGTMSGLPVALAVMDFAFMGGSMGSVLGEKVTRTMELALEQNIPCIVVTSTGGARMQEGILSLMQMAKTSILCAMLEERRVPFISILTDPSTAGVMASFASLGDLIIAEPGAYIGFAGRRVIEQTIKQPLPPNFQTSEFQRQHGFVDMVVKRPHLRPTIIRSLRLMLGQPSWEEESDILGDGIVGIPVPA